MDPSACSRQVSSPHHAGGRACWSAWEARCSGLKRASSSNGPGPRGARASPRSRRRHRAGGPGPGAGAAGAARRWRRGGELVLFSNQLRRGVEGRSGRAARALGPNGTETAQHDRGRWWPAQRLGGEPIGDCVRCGLAGCGRYRRRTRCSRSAIGTLKHRHAQPQGQCKIATRTMQLPSRTASLVTKARPGRGVWHQVGAGQVPGAHAGRAASAQCVFPRVQQVGRVGGQPLRVTHASLLGHCAAMLPADRRGAKQGGGRPPGIQVRGARAGRWGGAGEVRGGVR